eukprot:TRINITY_DN4906_c0_g2_i1.p4 TRINITY_DN4906_c0_g2~~TRINITY_DN4906_c0_g2_i1.p4  ORF type:complete len:106 (-),score=16.89 TRINITY_DN4906_c0_g2_i1:72-389(-)
MNFQQNQFLKQQSPFLFHNFFFFFFFFFFKSTKKKIKILQKKKKKKKKKNYEIKKEIIILKINSIENSLTLKQKIKLNRFWYLKILKFQQLQKFYFCQNCNKKQI